MAKERPEEEVFDFEASNDAPTKADVPRLVLGRLVSKPRPLIVPGQPVAPPPVLAHFDAIFAETRITAVEAVNTADLPFQSPEEEEEERDKTEIVRDRGFSFEEVATMLKGKIDLDYELKKAIKDHRRWGVMGAISDREIVDIDDYETLFRSHRFRRGGILELVRRLQEGEKWMPIFVPIDIDVTDFIYLFFQKIGVTFNKKAFELFFSASNLDLQKITFGADGALISSPDPEGLLTNTPRKPEIVFTPDIWCVNFTGRSPRQLIQIAQTRGVSYITPLIDFFRWVSQLDRILAARFEAAKQGSRADFSLLTNGDYIKFAAHEFKDINFLAFIPDQRVQEPEDTLQGDTRFVLYPTTMHEDGNFLAFGLNAGKRRFEILKCHLDAVQHDKGPRIILR